MTRKPLNLILMFLLSAAVAAAAFFAFKQTRFGDAPVREKVRIGLALQPPSALAILAARKGFFGEAGLDAEVIQFPSGKIALEDGLFTGQTDVITAADVAAVMASLERSDFKIIAAISFTANDHKMVALKESGIASPADLKAKKIGTQKGSALHYFLHLFLLKEGMDEKDVRLSFYPIEQLPDALASGEIDAATLREPYLEKAKRLLGAKAVFFEAPRLYSKNELAIVSDDFIRKHPEGPKKILRALLAAEQYWRAHPREAAQSVAEEMGMTEPLIGVEQGGNARFRVELAHSLVHDMENIADWALDHGEAGDIQKIPNYLNYIQTGDLKIVKPEAVDLVSPEKKKKYET